MRLLDSNIIIYAAGAGSASLDILLRQEVPAVSAVCLIVNIQPSSVAAPGRDGNSPVWR
jgi:hypothetical protein